jgi:CBS-domain-containing membrane protein
MLIKDIMSTCIRECTEDTPLKEVYKLIQDCEHGFVVVVDSATHRVPIGIVNEHSICEQVIARGRNAKALFAGSVMSTHVKRVNENTAIMHCREVIEKDPVAILIVDDERHLRGIVEPARLAPLVGEDKQPAASAPVFPSFVQRKTPGRVEIPAFGWAK